MAAFDEVLSVRLTTEFKDENGNDMSMSFNYAKEDVADATVKALMDGMIENGDIFSKNVPYEKVRAYLTKTERKELDVEDI